MPSCWISGISKFSNVGTDINDCSFAFHESVNARSPINGRVYPVIAVTALPHVFWSTELVLFGYAVDVGPVKPVVIPVRFVPVDRNALVSEFVNDELYRLVTVNFHLANVIVPAEEFVRLTVPSVVGKEDAVFILVAELAAADDIATLVDNHDRLIPALHERVKFVVVLTLTVIEQPLPVTYRVADVHTRVDTYDNAPFLAVNHVCQVAEYDVLCDHVPRPNIRFTEHEVSEELCRLGALEHFDSVCGYPRSHKEGYPVSRDFVDVPPLLHPLSAVTCKFFSTLNARE